ncbi:MAG: bifunctional phosphopantothenoylcysteine decarboxylase/phosphopantothenate--cysteine ligase CoaBC, partial [Acidaminococcaceae bacterium]|nr:bifunctional phosphopantothenoylcysteine decarboxylase/phosphopantothenate--cysteine ligase CoaBC [Acidaminococcaceae bacterium]
MLKGKKIVLGVTGGIAIYKAVDLVSKLRKQGAEVRVVMTEHATKFVSPLLFAEISGHKCAVSMWDGRDEFNVEHIALANWGDLLLVAPATANILAKMACGIADDLLSTVLLAASCPKIVCPAMNTGMYENAATQENLKTLAGRGIAIMEPASGELACGTTGAGRLPEVPEIIAYLERFLAQREGDMRGLKVMVTAAGTREPIDPVRFVGNRSSGKMGYSIARQALLRGADVTLITGPSALTPPPYAKVVHVETTKQMLDACLTAYPETDIVIKAAAVADFKPRSVADQKIQKIHPEDGMSIVMDQNPDILKSLGGMNKQQFLVGFAAESQNLLENAANKVKKKNLDM